MADVLGVALVSHGAAVFSSKVTCYSFLVTTFFGMLLMLEEFVRLPEFGLVSRIVSIGPVRPNRCLGVTLFYYFRFLFVTSENYGVERQGNLLTEILLSHVFNISTPVHHYAITPLRQYASTSVDVRQYTSTPEHQYVSTPVCQ